MQNFTYTDRQWGHKVTCKVTCEQGLLTQAEEAGVRWLAACDRWLDVTITRRSLREFDLSIEGTFDGDTGRDYDYSKVVRTKLPNGGEKVTGIQVRDRTTPKCDPCRFSAWFMLACLREFWGRGLIDCPHGDWSFIRDRDPAENWGVFESVLAYTRSRPVFSKEFLRACNGVWQYIAEDAAAIGGRLSNADALEMVLDRLGMHSASASEELQFFDERFGPVKVMAELNKQLRLV